MAQQAIGSCHEKEMEIVLKQANEIILKQKDEIAKLKEGKDLEDNGANPVQVEEETVQGDFVDEFASGGDY